MASARWWPGSSSWTDPVKGTPILANLGLLAQDAAQGGIGCTAAGLALEPGADGPRCNTCGQLCRPGGGQTTQEPVWVLLECGHPAGGLA